jgi:hypothetical protein
MAARKRTSNAKREREHRKRARELRKAEKAALKRERRFNLGKSEAEAQPGDEPPESDASPDQRGA